jgi:hypothetical protein
MRAEKARRRYWARSLVGWRRIRQAKPNDAHRALARLAAHQRLRRGVDGFDEEPG